MEFPSALSPLFGEPHYTKHVHSAKPSGRSHREQHPRNPYEFEEKTQEKKALGGIRERWVLAGVANSVKNVFYEFL